MAHFLVVEDFPPMATLLAMAIRREGHTVTRVGSVSAALGGEGVFDHAVLDVDLPDGNGIELAQCLLDVGRVNSVVFFTASRDPDLLAKAATLGLIVDKTAGYDCLMATLRKQLTAGYLATRVAIAGSPDSLTTHEPGRSGTRRKID